MMKTLVKLPPPARFVPVFAVFLMFFLNNLFAQMPIGTSSSEYSGNIYHTGGNIGIGTTSPVKKLHIAGNCSDPSNPDPSSLRLETGISENSVCILYSWDISNINKSLIFSSDYSSGKELSVKFIMDSAGRFVVNPEADINKLSAILQINASDAGILIPRMSTADKNNIISPANGLLVFDTDLHALSYYDENTSSWFIVTQSGNLSDYLLISDFNASVAGGITQSDTANWNTAFGWGNHADFGYLTAASQDSLSNKTGNISMWTNDVGYITEADINNLWQENSEGNIYRENGYVGIGTENPSEPLEIYSFYNGSLGGQFNKSVIRLTNRNGKSKIKALPGPGPVPPSNNIYKWDIENDNDSLKFKYISYNPSDIALEQPIPEPETKFTFSGDGTLTAVKFIGDGSGLTNAGPWQTNGNNIYYDNGNVGIGISNPDTKLQLNNGAIKISGGSSLGQGPRFQINTGVSTAHVFLEFKNDNGEQFTVYGNGLIRAKKIKVQSNWSDYVFKSDYGLMPLNKLETYIKQNKHLPEIPSETEIIQNGLDLGDMQKLQMQKIEELTLYIIELNKRIESLEKENTELKRK